jgi:glutathione S-transferase
MKPNLIIGNKNYSSWSLRAWFLLREAGIDFDEHRILLDTDTTGEEIAVYSAAGRVPILVLDGVTVWDTMAIAEHARSICAEMHSGFEVLRQHMPMNCRAMGRRVPLPDELTDDIDRIMAIWTDCHRRYGDIGPWLFGDFSVADAMYAPVALRFRTYGINLNESARFYPKRVLESEAMQEWLAACESEVEVIEREETGQ